MINSFLALVSYISTAILSVSMGFLSDPLVVVAIESYEPAIDINNSNQAALAWCTLSDQTTSIFFSEYDGNEWSESFQLSETGKNTDPKLRIDQSGNILCAWQSINDDSRSIFASKKLSGGSWESPSLLSQNANAHCFNFTATKEGYAVIGWINHDLNTIEIVQGQIDGNWQEVATIYSSVTSLSDLTLRITDGNIYILWSDQEQFMFAQTVSGFNSEWTTPTSIHASTHCLNLNFSVAENGNAMVSWIDETTAQLQTLMYVNGVWEVEPMVHDIQTYTFKSVADHSNFYLTWLSASTGKVEAITYSNDVWGEVVEVSQDLCYGRPNIKSYSLESVLISWTDAMSGQVMLTDFSSSGVVGTPITISDGILNMNPKISTNGTATAVAWEHYEGSELEIRVSVLQGTAGT